MHTEEMAFSDVEHLCAGIVKDLQLTPSACLLVNYSIGTSAMPGTRSLPCAMELESILC